MTTSRLLLLCTALVSFACAGSKNSNTDDGPAASAGDSKQGAEQGAQQGGQSGEGGAAEAGEAEAGEAGGQACASDADCVPAECRHPSTCTVASAAPSCGDVMCTMECRPGTLDCGQGQCLCQNGTCVAQIGEAG